ncbi:MAG: c-type cytochrome [Proteobacteria bacterium]|nr:c-type cytochrome [Pseudomonadota bacterium]
MSFSKTALISATAIAFATFVSGAAFAADAARGAKIYEEQGCNGCHAAKEVLVGPPHCGVVGREAGSIEGYAYSEVMRSSGLTWDEQNLNQFIESPLTFLSGTNMGFAGLFDEKDRTDLIEFLKTQRAAGSPDCQ